MHVRPHEVFIVAASPLAHPMPDNLEIKVRAPNLSKVERIARNIGRRVFSGVQVDTYFRVPKGRLKLRETPEGSELIWYRRPNKRAARWSSYSIIEVHDPEKVKSLFEELLGVKRVVKKHRKVYIYGDARIHLDRVDGLGNFVEIEVVRRGSREGAQAQMKSLCQTLGLNGLEAIDRSYSDLKSRPKR